MSIPREKIPWIYEKMVTIRGFEDRVHKEFAKGSIPGFVHLYAGEEAVAVGVCAHLDQSDFIASTHRGHGHTIAKECDLNGTAAEIFGRETGLCKGKGGSMHIADVERGMLGANGLVGGGIPLACGAGLTGKFNKKGQVSVAFFGDGASEQGTFHEGLNLAAIWKLPVLFVAENNMYAEATPVEYHLSGANIADRAAGYRIPGVVVDGLDVFDVYEKAGEAVKRARAGEGPSLLECRTYRYYGHFEGDAQTYRKKEEVEEHRAKDCIEKFRKRALKEKLADEAALDEIDQKVAKAVEEAFRLAEQAPLPAAEDALNDVYVHYR